MTELDARAWVLDRAIALGLAMFGALLVISTRWGVDPLIAGPGAVGVAGIAAGVIVTRFEVMRPVRAKLGVPEPYE